MNCPRVQRLFFEDHGRLSPEQQAAMIAHLRDCPACRRLGEALVTFEGKVRAAAEQQPALQPALRHHLIDRWIAEQAVLARGRRTWLVFHSLAAVGRRRAEMGLVTLMLAAVLSLALVGDSLSPFLGPPAPPPASSSGPASVGPYPPRPGRAAPIAALPPGRRIVPGAAAETPAPAAADGAGERREVGPAAASLRKEQSRRPEVLASANRDLKPTSRQQPSLSPQEWEKFEAQVRRRMPVKDDFIRIPFPRLADANGGQMVAAMESYRREAAVVDARQAREVTLRIKATALSDLCERLRADTGIDLVAGRSVADEKVIVFCKNMPLREVMRQLSRPFGYTWIRSGKTGAYRYELMQDLRSQLLEEELRNRDRNAALLALEREIERFRSFLHLSPDEALAQSKAASPAVRSLLERLAGVGWGPIQMYFRLSPRELAALRAGQTLTFSTTPKAGELLLPPELRHGVLQGQRSWRLVKTENGGWGGTLNPDYPGALLLTSVPEAGAMLSMRISQTEPGRFGLDGASGHFLPPAPGERTGHSLSTGDAPFAMGMNTAGAAAENEGRTSQTVHDPALSIRVTIQPQSSCEGARRQTQGDSPAATAAPGVRRPASSKVTSADVLEALHHATGHPVVADYYTHLHKPDGVSFKNQRLAEGLNQLAGVMRLRWHRDGGWLQFRRRTYFHDRLKEVPNRLLSRWSAARQAQGMLTLDDLVEIAQLPDAQLDGNEMAEGARECWGLVEWYLARNSNLRPHLRFLGEFTPEQRQQAMSAKGLPFTRMSLRQQQGFLSRVLNQHRDDDRPLQSLDELQGAVLRVDYTQPGWFQWTQPRAITQNRWVGLTPQGRRVLMPLLREPTRAATLQAARRLMPQVEESEIYPTELDLMIVYIPGTSNDRLIRCVGPTQDTTPG